VKRQKKKKRKKYSSRGRPYAKIKEKDRRLAKKDWLETNEARADQGKKEGEMVRRRWSPSFPGRDNGSLISS